MSTASAPRVCARDSQALRILQVTDLHTDACETATRRSFDALAAAVRAERPDLLAVTGDLWCSDTRPELASILMLRDLAFLADLGVPWAFTPGNHDCIPDPARVRREMGCVPRALLDPARPLGAFRVEACDPEGTPRWDLYFANSGEAWQLPGDLAWMAPEAAALAGARGTTLPALAFFHIPTRTYRDAMAAGTAVGLAQETVLCTGDEEDAAHGLLRGVPGLAGCFCGHSHRNDFHVVRDGIRYAYGRVGGFGGYGAEDTPRGIKRIVLGLRDGRIEADTLCFA
jgi:hypothetical protein